MLERRQKKRKASQAPPQSAEHINPLKRSRNLTDRDGDSPPRSGEQLCSKCAAIPWDDLFSSTRRIPAQRGLRLATVTYSVCEFK